MKMSLYKLSLNQNVLNATQERMTWTLENFARVCVSFSGGKDSTVMLYLACECARRMRRKIDVLFIDWEAQFTSTIQHIENMRTHFHDVIDNFWWVALPLTTQNSLSQFQPEWQCWEAGTNWVRQPPSDAITDPGYFDFYQQGMTFEAFVRAFSEWFSQNRPAAVMIGIRADESYNRFLAIANARKLRFADDKPWTTVAPGGHAWYVYPIYDWKTADIWTWFAKTGSSYNTLYDLMYQAGSPCATCAFVNLLAPSNARGYGSIMLSNPSGGRPCANASAVSGAEVSMPVTTIISMATAKFSNRPTLAGRNTPFAARQHATTHIRTLPQQNCRVFALVPQKRHARYSRNAGRGYWLKGYSLVAAHLQGTSE
jgi:3'-phosphoadenosine 5'-phosphosulfate sulfotransferase (PAPS reductase)/FAD synthetase